MVNKTCEYCGKIFLVKPCKKETARFCSYSCRSKVISPKSAEHWKYNGGSIKFNCSVCGKETVRRRGITGGTYQYCSSKCSNIAKIKKIQITCKNCNKEFFITQSHYKRGSRFCSHRCSSEYLSGNNSHRWKGGERGRKYYPKEWNNTFKRMIRERDNYTCAVCKQDGKDVHHINYVKMDTTPENCITLCKSCHARTNSNREYWQEYFQKLMLRKCDS